MNLTTPLEAERQVAEARALFGRFLSIWASQLLELERIGSCSPSFGSFDAHDGADDWSAAA